MNYYLHIPFCRSKCGYCAFYSRPSPPEELVECYLQALEERFHPEFPAETLYIGGGTPTYLSISQLERLFSLLRSRLEFLPGAEISCEANPETLDEEKVSLLRSFVTRLSMGVQSFEESARLAIGRHCSQTALEKALELVQKARFPHWNTDLIFALPGQSDEAFFAGLEQAVNLGVDHISCYALTAEEQAVLKLPEDEERAGILLPQIAEFLHARGIERYEVSNYARSGGECRHNINVWRGGLLHGFGPAAASFDGKRRTIERESIEEWLKGTPPVQDVIPPEARLNEIFAVNLRTVWGWTPELWAKVPGCDSWNKRLSVIAEVMKKLPADWFIFTPERIALTGEGLLFWNSVAGEIF